MSGSIQLCIVTVYTETQNMVLCMVHFVFEMVDGELVSELPLEGAQHGIRNGESDQETCLPVRLPGLCMVALNKALVAMCCYACRSMVFAECVICKYSGLG